MIRKIVVGSILGLCIAIIIIQARIIMFNDLSTLSINSIGAPDFGQKEFQQRPPVYLVSYADGPEIFFKNQNALATSALNRGIDFILNYRRSQLDKDFVAKNEATLKQRPGAGYWLWKPYVILKTLKQAPENAIIIYADSGLLFQKPVTPYLKLLGDKDVMLLDCNHAVDGYPLEKTKRDVFVRLKCDEPKCWDGNFIWAAFMVLRNTPKARQFIQEWLTLCEDPLLLTDQESKLPPHPRTKQHQHDQSILGALYNSKMKESADYLTLLTPAQFGEFTWWAHRHPGKDYHSLLDDMAHYPVRKFDRVVLNNSLTKAIRKAVL